MSASFVYRPHPETPAVASCRPHPPLEDPNHPWNGGGEALRFDVVSRGDFVPGRLYLPAGASASAPAPLILIQHGLGQSMSSPALDFAAPWLLNGWAVAMTDLPLHGERSSPKLSARLEKGINTLTRHAPLDPDTEVLVEEFARQATSDLMRTIEALAGHEAIDADRTGLVGFSTGAMIASFALAQNPPIRCAALAGLGGGQGRADLDPASYLASPRTKDSALLVIGEEGQGASALASAKALFEAASGPKEWFLSKDNRPESLHPAADTTAALSAFFNEKL